MGWFSFLKQAAASVPTPAAGKVAIFVDDTSGVPSYKGEDGVAHSLGGGSSGVSSVNSRTGAITLAPGTNVTINESPEGTFTFSASGGGGGGVGLPWFFFEDYGGDPTGAADSTTAIQNCINAAAAAGGGVCASKQVNALFLISGALQDTSRGNAQILFPSVNYVSEKQVTIRIQGYVAPPSIFSVIGSTPLPTAGLRFKSTLTTGTGAVFGGWGPVGTGLGNFSNVCIELEKLTVQTVANPTITAVDCGWMACLSAKDVVCHTGTYAVASITAPTTATSFGLITPKNGNGAHTVINDCTMIGFYNAYGIYEHGTGNNVNFAGCNQGLVFNNADHASMFGRVCSVHCVYPVVGPASGAHSTNIQQLDIEHSTGSFATIYDLQDSGNRLYGSIAWYSVTAGTPGPAHAFTNNGGQNCLTPEVGNPPGVRAVTGTDTAGLKDNGGVISYTNSSAVNMTIPPEGSVPWKVGTILTWIQSGTGQITIVAGSGVTITPATPKSRAQYSPVSAVKTGTNTWAVMGDLA
jgi:hypothetical protein